MKCTSDSDAAADADGRYRMPICRADGDDVDCTDDDGARRQGVDTKRRHTYVGARRNLFWI